MILQGKTSEIFRWDWQRRERGRGVEPWPMPDAYLGSHTLREPAQLEGRNADTDATLRGTPIGSMNERRRSSNGVGR